MHGRPLIRTCVEGKLPGLLFRCNTTRHDGIVIAGGKGKLKGTKPMLGEG
jgi:hypothetical protein